MNYSKQRGFNLIELLLSIAIFSGLSIAAYQVLDGVMRSNRHSETKLDRLSEMQRAFFVIEDDFRQMVQTTGRVGSSQNQALIAAPGYAESEDFGLAFIRGGWSNPGARLPRSELTRVGYRVREKKLERLFFLYPDPVINSEPHQLEIMQDVTAFKIRFYNNGRWQTQWDPKNNKLPQGIELAITSEAFGTVRRIFTLAGG